MNEIARQRARDTLSAHHAHFHTKVTDSQRRSWQKGLESIAGWR